MGGPATHRMYLDTFDDAYRTDFTAEVVAVDGQQVVLDRTLFYPTGGGQPCDLGTMEGPTGRLEVQDVAGRGAVQHTVDADHALAVGEGFRAPSTGNGATPTCACTPRSTCSAGSPTASSRALERSATRSAPNARASTFAR